MQDYNRHMGYVDKSDHMTNSYSGSRWTWKWTKKLFFHLMDLTILNSFIILASCGSKFITLAVQIDIGEGPNTGGRKGALTSDRKRKKTSPIHEPNTKT